jgi:hypothetical protein
MCRPSKPPIPFSTPRMVSSSEPIDPSTRQDGVTKKTFC